MRRKGTDTHLDMVDNNVKTLAQALRRLGSTSTADQACSEAG